MAAATITAALKVSPKIEPKFEILNSGTKVCKVFGSYSLRKGSGENAKTTYVNCEVLFWGNNAETAKSYIKPGSWIYVTGVPEPRVYVKQDEGPKVIMTIDMKDWSFIGEKPATTGQDAGRQAQGNGQAPPQSCGGYDDDIPF